MMYGLASAYTQRSETGRPVHIHLNMSEEGPAGPRYWLL